MYLRDILSHLQYILRPQPHLQTMLDEAKEKSGIVNPVVGYDQLLMIVVLNYSILYSGCNMINNYEMQLLSHSIKVTY